MKNRVLVRCLLLLVLGSGVVMLSGCTQPTPIVITVIPPPVITVVVTSTGAPLLATQLLAPTGVSPSPTPVPGVTVMPSHVPPTASHMLTVPPLDVHPMPKPPILITVTRTRVPTGTPTRTPTRPPSITHSTGPLSIQQTYLADLDEGKITSGTTADIWFEAVTATQRYVTPVNGARIAKAGMTSIGRNGCAAAPLSSTRININDLPIGSYVCVRTNQGRYSQFRVNAAVGPSPGTLVIGYTTWQ